MYVSSAATRVPHQTCITLASPVVEPQQRQQIHLWICVCPLAPCVTPPPPSPLLRRRPPPHISPPPAPPWSCCRARSQSLPDTAARPCHVRHCMAAASAAPLCDECLLLLEPTCLPGACLPGACLPGACLRAAGDSWPRPSSTSVLPACAAPGTSWSPYLSG